MLYMVESVIDRPGHISDDAWQSLVDAELEYGLEARRAGHLVDIWRISGRYAAFSVWDARDHDHLHEILSNLPLYPYVELKVTALATHPSTAAWENTSRA